MSEVVSSFSKRYLARLLRLAYPLIFWASFFRIVELTQYSPPQFISNTIRVLQPIYTDIGVIAFAFLVLVMLVFSYLSLGPYRSIQQNVPFMVRDLLRKPSSSAELALKKKINELMVAAFARSQLVALGILSGLKRSVSNHPKTSFFAAVAYYTIVYPGSIVLTIDILGIIAPIAEPLLGNLRYLLTTLSGAGILLLVLSFFDFTDLAQELRRPSQRAFSNPLVVSRAILEEFTVLTQLVFLLDSALWFSIFGLSFKGSVECPDNNTLSEIIEGTLFNEWGRSLVLFYRTEELLPLPHMKAITRIGPEASHYMKHRQPAAFIGIDKDKCVLIAYIARDDVRRMNIWTQSPAITKTIVTKCRKAIFSIKPYGN